LFWWDKRAKKGGVDMSESGFREMLEKMDLHEIERLKTAKEALTWLEGRRQALQEQMGKVEEQIAGVKEGRLDPNSVLPRGGTKTPAKGTTRKRRKQEGSLASRVTEVLQGKENGLGIEEIAKAVLEAGYETKGKNFRQQVAIALANAEEIERVGRGVYRLKVAE